MWQAACNTGHYPFACDIDGDGKDEVRWAIPSSTTMERLLWSLDGQLQDHADGVAIVRFKPDRPDAFHARPATRASSSPTCKARSSSTTTWATFRIPLWRISATTCPAWRPFYQLLGQPGDHPSSSMQRADVYHDCEPSQYGSMCLPINWTGRTEEVLRASPNVEEGGLFDGWGARCHFPDDGHPDMCNAVLDVTGDCRDEIVVWDPYELWVYTQNDNPKSGRLYKPRRNPLYNYSNYQATVSLPGWSETVEAAGGPGSGIIQTLPGQVGLLFRWSGLQAIPAQRYVTGREGVDTLRARRNTVDWIMKVIHKDWLPKDPNYLEQNLIMIQNEQGPVDATHVRWLINGYTLEVSQTMTVLALKMTPMQAGVIPSVMTERRELIRQMLCEVVNADVVIEVRGPVRSETIHRNVQPELLRASFDEASVEDLADGIRSSCSNDASNLKDFNYWWHRINWWTDASTIGIYTLKTDGGAWKAGYGSILDDTWFEGGPATR